MSTSHCAFAVSLHISLSLFSPSHLWCLLHPGSCGKKTACSGRAMSGAVNSVRDGLSWYGAIPLFPIQTQYVLSTENMVFWCFLSGYFMSKLYVLFPTRINPWKQTQACWEGFLCGSAWNGVVKLSHGCWNVFQYSFYCHVLAISCTSWVLVGFEFQMDSGCLQSRLRSGVPSHEQVELGQRRAGRVDPRKNGVVKRLCPQM